MEPASLCALPYQLRLPPVQRAPVILNSPHSGRHYLPAFLASSCLDAVAIRRSEDSFVDELFAAGPSLGLPLLAANFPRAYCDVNREAWELDPAMFADELPGHVNTASPRVLAGLGTIARVVGNNEPIYHGKLRFAEAEARIAGCWEPYHAALRGLIADTVARFGTCLVIDCHSMPSLPGRGPARAQIVLGDGHGTSCDARVSKFMHDHLHQRGLDVRRNDPYAGGYITRHYGRPRERVQVVQIEIARGLYMNERHFRRSESFGGLKNTIGLFLAAIAEGAAGLLEADLPILSTAAE